jgi:penicillin-binding protein 2
MFYMQTFQHSGYFEMSEENRIRIDQEIAVRGKMLDRHERLLVDNRPSYVVAAVPNEVPRDLQLISFNLSSLLDIPAERISSQIERNRYRRHEPVKLRRNVPFEVVCRIEEASDDYPGIVLQLSQSREYPPGGSGAHLLGYLSGVTEAELDRLRGKGFHLGSLVGRKGIEKTYDDFLRGKDGTRYLEVSAEGKIIGPLKERDAIEAIPGFDVKLTLDYDLQFFGESLFGDTLTGAAVAIEPNTGAVLAFVSQPSYDANLFTGPLSEEDWQRLKTDKRHPLLNRCIQATYPPGSVYKLIVAGAGLESGVISPQTRFLACTGGYRYGNRVFKCHKLSGHGVLRAIDAIAASCDVYFYQLGKELGLKRFAEYSRACGFGSPTGIDLADEASGLIPDAEYYDKRFGEGRWPRSLILNLSIGQGEVLVTPLQMAVFYAALANDGRVMQPNALYSLITPHGEILKEPEELYQLPFSRAVLAILDSALIDVVQGELGTAPLARVEGTVVAGKTGTAQNPHGNEHSWFCAFAPARDPRIAVACVVENAGHGGSVAAPMVGRMIQRYLRSIDIIPDSIPTQLTARERDGAEH